MNVGSIWKVLEESNDKIAGGELIERSNCMDVRPYREKQSFIYIFPF